MDWLLKLCRREYDFLGEPVVVFRAANIYDAPVAIQQGFLDNRYFATTEERAVFYSHFYSENELPGLIIECLIDSTKSHVDANDILVSESDSAYDQIKSLADEIADVLQKESIPYDHSLIENQIGYQVGSDVAGHYQKITTPSLWVLLSQMSGGKLSIDQAKKMFPPGEYPTYHEDSYIILDNRGVFGVNAANPSQQTKYLKSVPPEHFRGVYIHNMLLDKAKVAYQRDRNGYPVGGMHDILTTIPGVSEDFVMAMDDMNDKKLLTPAVFQYLKQIIEDMNNRWEDEHGSAKMNGRVFEKLYTFSSNNPDPITEEDINSKDGFVWFELPRQKYAILNIIAKARQSLWAG